MNAHVTNIARTCYLELRRLASIRRFLTSIATATLVSAFALSRIDYCNSINLKQRPVDCTVLLSSHSCSLQHPPFPVSWTVGWSSIGPGEAPQTGLSSDTSLSNQVTDWTFFVSRGRVAGRHGHPLQHGESQAPIC